VLCGHESDRRRARVAVSVISLVASVSVVHEPPPPIVGLSGRYLVDSETLARRRFSPATAAVGRAASWHWLAAEHRVQLGQEARQVPGLFDVVLPPSAQHRHRPSRDHAEDGPQPVRENGTAARGDLGAGPLQVPQAMAGVTPATGVCSMTWRKPPRVNPRGRPRRRQWASAVSTVPVRGDGHDNPEDQRDNAADPCSPRQGVRPPLIPELALRDDAEDNRGR
jgi:hypothetical protein